MPNPKVGTVTMDVAKAVSESKAGKIEYRTDRHAIVHLPIGKTSFDEQVLLENYAALIDEIVRAKPAAAKGRYLYTVTLTTTHGPGRARRPGADPRHRRGARRCSLTRHSFSARDPRRIFVSPGQVEPPRASCSVVRARLAARQRNEMNREQKAAVIEEVATQIQESEAVFAVDYRGISVPQAADLRTAADRGRRALPRGQEHAHASAPPTRPAPSR